MIKAPFGNLTVCSGKSAFVARYSKSCQIIQISNITIGEIIKKSPKIIIVNIITLYPIFMMIFYDPIVNIHFNFPIQTTKNINHPREITIFICLIANSCCFIIFMDPTPGSFPFSTGLLPRSRLNAWMFLETSWPTSLATAAAWQRL